MSQLLEVVGSVKCRFGHIEPLVDFDHNCVVRDWHGEGLTVGEGLVDAYLVSQCLEVLDDGCYDGRIGTGFIIVIPYADVDIRGIGIQEIG